MLVFILEADALAKVERMLREERRADIAVEQAMGPSKRRKCAVIVLEDADQLDRMTVFAKPKVMKPEAA